MTQPWAAPPLIVGGWPCGLRGSQRPSDFRRHTGIVVQQGDVGGAAFVLGQLADAGQQKRRDFLAAHALSFRLLQGPGDGGFRHVGGQLVFRRDRGGDQRAGLEAERFARTQDGGDILRGVAADVEGRPELRV